MIVLGVLVRTTEEGGSCVHELGLLWFGSGSYTSYRVHNVMARSQNKRALGSSYNMAVGLQEVMV